MTSTRRSFLLSPRNPSSGSAVVSCCPPNSSDNSHISVHPNGPATTTSTSKTPLRVQIPTAPFPPPPGTPMACDIGDRDVCFKNVLGRADVPDHLVTGFIHPDGLLEELYCKWPDWPRPFSTASPPLHKIVQVDGFGLSMVATTNIGRGQVIVTERPLLMYPASMPLPVKESLAYLEFAVSSLREENRKAVYALRNVKGPDWLSHLKGIMDTNSLGTSGGMPGHRAQYAGLARDISRANHSCLPNAASHFDLETFTYSLRASRPIRAGEQITITYIDLHCGHAERQEELLRRYKFQCTCTICARDPGERALSDFRRAFMTLRRMDTVLDNAAFDKWLADGAPDNTLLVVMSDPAELLDLFDSGKLDGFQRALVTYQIMEEEGWSFYRLWESVVERLVQGYSVLEDEEAVRHYALAAAIRKKIDDGTDGGWTAVARYPRQTEWWGKLGKERVRTNGKSAYSSAHAAVFQVPRHRLFKV